MELLEYEHVKDNATTHRLIDAIVELVNEKSIDSITTTEIANRAGINRATFYSYFSDKYALIKYVYYHAVKDMDEMFKRYDTFIYSSKHIKKALSTTGQFLAKALESSGDHSLASFISYYWIKFNKQFYKDETGEETVPDDLTMSIEMWVYGLVAEMRSVSRASDETKRKNYEKLQLVHAPKEIRKLLIKNSLKAGFTLSDLGVKPDEIA
ncbi:MAG: TetR/AcrR family transcriptional regulator [Dehalococcoidales bacterium]|nr:TetR/AcrR family transcriptional regulator [Dehalococcoidales bacterium]